MSDLIVRAENARRDCVSITDADKGIGLRASGAIEFLLQHLVPELVAEVKRLQEVVKRGA